MITLEPKDFVWRVGQECHRWITADARLGSGKERFLTDAVPIGTAGYRTSLPLLDHSMLFREFAATPSNEAAIAAFADRNGMLGKGVVLPVGDGNDQQLLLIVREEHGFVQHALEGARFVPLLSGTLA